MAISVVGTIDLQASGNNTNDLELTGFPASASGDLLLLSLGGEGSSPTIPTLTVNLSGGSTATATLIARDYGQTNNNSSIQIHVFGYVIGSAAPTGVTVDSNRKKIAGGYILRGADTANFSTWVAATTGTSYDAVPNTSKVTDIPVDTTDEKGGWTTANYGTEAAFYTAFSQRAESNTYVLNVGTGDSTANWEIDVLSGSNPPRFESGMAIRPDSAPGTAYSMIFQSNDDDDHHAAALAIAIPASTSTGSLIEPNCKATASGETSGVLNRTVPISGSATGEVSASSSASRTATPSAQATGASTATAEAATGVTLLAAATGVIGTTATATAARSLSAAATMQADGSATASREATPAAQATGALSSSARLSRTANLDAAAAGSSSATVQIDTGVVLNAAATAQAEGTANASRTALLISEATAVATAAATASRTVSLAGSATAESSGSTLTKTDDELSGAASGVLSTQATIQRAASVTSTGTASSESTAQVSRTASIQGQASGESASQVSPTIEGAVDIQGAATSSLNSIAVASRTTHPSATAEVSASATSQSSRTASIHGSVDAVLAGQANISKDRDIAGAITIEVSTQAGLAVTRNLNASINVSTAAEARPDFTLGFSGSADAQAQGSVVADLSMTVTSNGEASGTAKVTIEVTESEPFLKAGAKSLVSIEVLTEAITYYPGGNLSAGKSIRAVVQRDEPELLALALEEGALTVQVELWIATDPTIGVSTVKAGKDLADVVVTEGKAAERVRIVEVLDQDPGMVHLLGVR